MTSQLELVWRPVLSPVGAPDADLGPMPESLATLREKRIVFWHDSTPEADVVFPVIKKYLLDKGVKEVLLAKQPAPASPPLESNLNLVRESDAAVLGVAW